MFGKNKILWQPLRDLITATNSEVIAAYDQVLKTKEQTYYKQKQSANGD